jgi:hypothetical protein
MIIPIFLIATGRSNTVSSGANASRFFCLDVGDWSMLLIGVALSALLVMLV